MNSKTYSPWPYAIVSSFVILILFDIYFVRSALTTATGTVVDNPYEESLVYDQIVKGKKAASAAGLTMKFESLRSGFRIEINGLPENNTRTMKIVLMRPADPSLDRTFLVNSQSKIFEVKTELLQNGLWILQADLKSQQEFFRFESQEVVG